MKKRYAIITDIHGNKEALESILDDIKKQNIDETYCLGDTIGIGPESKECIDILIKNKIKSILGNHELYAINGIDDNIKGSERLHHEWVKGLLDEDSLLYLRGCPLKIERVYNNKKMLFEHFLMENNSFLSLSIIDNNEVVNYSNKVDSDYIFIGHEHKPFILEDKNMLVDVGSSGCVKDDNTFYTIINIDNDIKIEKKFIKYDRNSFINCVRINDYPERKDISKHFFDIDVGE